MTDSVLARAADASPGLSGFATEPPAVSQPEALVPSREPYKLLDLFSGIGGFSLGLERTGGFETVAFCEINSFGRKVLAKHWPKVPCYDDVRAITADRLAADGISVTAISAGFPCQDISFAGLGAGLSGERSGLFYEIIRIAREIGDRDGRVPLIILENVAALLSRGLGEVLRALAALGCDAEWHCIPASAVGAAHRRDRIWIVAYPACERRREAGQHGQRSAQRFAGSGALVAYADDVHEQGFLAGLSGEEEWPQPLLRSVGPRSDGLGCWTAEPNVGRMAYGVPDRAHRLRALGNAVVPQIPELIGRAILASERIAA